jgi:hypothetical protein
MSWSGSERDEFSELTKTSSKSKNNFVSMKFDYLPCDSAGSDCKYIHTAFSSPSVI